MNTTAQAPQARTPAAQVAWAVEASGVIKEFSGSATLVALDDVRMACGQLTALVGPDGAGKTTFMRLIAGLLSPDAGSLKVLGMDVIDRPQAVQDRISYMPQRFGLYEDLSVQENLDLYADLHGVRPAQRERRFRQMLQMTGLAPFTERLAGKLSGGMKQKLGLACTLVRSPSLLLLDEPTVGVDPLSRRELWQIVRQLMAAEQLSVLVSTAYMDEAEQCAQVYVMYDGKVLARGSPQELRSKAQGMCHIATPPAAMPARLMQARLIDDTENIIDAVPVGGEVRYIARPKANAEHLRLLLDGAATRPVQASLEDGVQVLIRAQLEPALRPPAEISPSYGASSAQSIIKVRNLVRKFGEFVAVDSTSFDVRKGEIFGLLGPNGAGKTTTFRMLCGLLPASSGELQVAGVDLRTARARARRKVGYMSQKYALYGNLTVGENLSFFGGAYGLAGRVLRERIAAVVDEFDLTGQIHARSGNLPGGFKQRLAMAAALLHEPEILFLDEPTSGIDPIARRNFWRRITALSQAGTTIIVTTHFMEEAEYCDRIVIQDAGRILAMGTPDEVRRRAGRDGMADMNAVFIGIVEQARGQHVQAPDSQEPLHE